MLLMDTIGPSACGDSSDSQERRPVLVFKPPPIIRDYSPWTGHSETRVRLSLFPQDVHFGCFCLLGEEKPGLFFPFHDCFALLALLERAGRIAVIISPDTTPEQPTQSARFWRFSLSFWHKIESNRKLRLADHFIFNFHASLSPPTQAKTIDLHDWDFLHEGFKGHWRELLNKNSLKGFLKVNTQKWWAPNILKFDLLLWSPQVELLGDRRLLFHFISL